jgi:hypothetical protein
MDKKSTQPRLPRLLIARSLALPPVECCCGTRPSQVARSRLLRKAVPFPIAAVSAVAVSGPMPRIVSSLRQLSSFFAAWASSRFVASTCSSNFSHSSRSSISSVLIRVDRRFPASSSMEGRLSLEMSGGLQGRRYRAPAETRAVG